ncbi:MAG: GNAT family N-acetyltransferase [Phenylobacterium sp.]|uniref:GNAT family N-acetyltransferase n=1 Tax=Phenylobacterium sp. TaxID=1871053 RepID=UPI00273394EA|nr:GNAT family N-acetyltransferase [Phenylobacterium sp.]MDP3175012.1 GNAT family N-acetyltransferase [Phenylobacterium sp.]
MPHYRAYEHGDLDAVAALWLDSFLSVGLGIEAGPVEALRARIPLELADDWQVTVAMESGEIVGFLAVKPATKVLDQLFITPSAKGMGIGTALLQKAMALMPAGFTLRTQRDNQRARAFYIARGLRQIEPPVAASAFSYPVVYYAWP